MPENCSENAGGLFPGVPCDGMDEECVETVLYRVGDTVEAWHKVRTAVVVAVVLHAQNEVNGGPLLHLCPQVYRSVPVFVCVLVCV